jgi:hypothetical protein
MMDGQLAQDGEAWPTDPDLDELFGAGTESVLGRRRSHALLRHLASPVRRTEAPHDVAGAPPNCLPILAQRADIDLAGEFRDLGFAHADAEVPARDPQAIEPTAVQYLVPPHQDDVHHDVLGAGNVPHQPGQRGPEIALLIVVLARKRTCR